MKLYLPPASLLCLLIVLFPGTLFGQDQVRIRLSGNPQVIVVSGTTTVVLQCADYSDRKVGAGTPITIRRQGGAMSVEAGPISFMSMNLGVSGGSTLRIAYGGRSPRTYAGALRVTPARGGGLQVVNHVPLEDYVAAVVASEYGLDDLEGSKAMAVAARTYALSAADASAAYDHVDDIAAQVYEGAGRVTPMARKAAVDTRGEVLRYKGRLAHTTYHSSSGGYTAANDEVWRGSEPLPYLRARPDPHDRSPHSTWQSRIPVVRLHGALSKRFGGSVTGFTLHHSSIDGRSHTITLHRTGGATSTVSGNDFRVLIIRTFGADGLRSLAFTMERTGNDYVFTGRGNGHGVGMSQWGAHEMAKRGSTYRQILDFYYPGTTTSGGANRAADDLIRTISSEPSPSAPPLPKGYKVRRRTVAGAHVNTGPAHR